MRDVYAEELCEPDNSPPTRASTHYVFNGQCRALDTFNAGTLAGTPLIYNVSVHGPVFATATVGGKPYALSRRRSTFGRDGLNLAALKDMTEGKAYTAVALLEDRQPVRLHVQLGLRLAQEDGVLLVRISAAPGEGPRSAAADARDRTVRVERVPEDEEASA